MIELLQQGIATIQAIGLEKVFLLLMAPVFAVFMAWEAWHLHRRRAQTYSVAQVGTNVFLATSHAIADGIAWLLVIGLFYALYQVRLFDIPFTWWSVILLLVLQDFFYYFFHRASHRMRWMWASHVTHHSSETMNLATALRQSVTYPISGMWVFWLPLAWIGFQPEMVILAVAISLGYQFFVHTESVKKMPRWFEAVFNTPSHHRVHHARNPQYIDRNYAGVLIIWDKLFGSFVPEEAPCEYGIVRQIHTRNPFVMMFHEWRDMFRDVARPGPLWLRLKHLWAPPEWERPSALDVRDGQQPRGIGNP
ncbi:sterol desaturase family protein [Flagellatimonas centrodinii]|uniref:sterol desaturase family protein n=1 Tax=Flagellatimonas centrodinii TaxID=2806210 RepID=UPI001FEF4EA8|nr:sterol desaturase family protein [Flagellatimonas centrodinii]ULQ47543.1 sterol desaturase family protein [Flagellatimonas centrodinii]